MAIGVAAALVPVAGIARPAAVTPPTDPTVGPLESGTSAYVAGTYAWTDYAYDDHGPNAAAGSPGAATYPGAQDQSNAADLIQLQAALDGRGSRANLSFTAVLQTLTTADEPLLGIGLDTDRNAATGAPSLPGGQWHSNGALGIDFLLTASSDGGALSRWTGTAWQSLASLPASVDPAANTITTSVNLSSLPAATTFNAVAALGLRRSEASWLAGTGPIYDLAFVRAEEPHAGGNMLTSAEQVAVTHQGHATGGQWQDVRQADVLAGNLPASNAVATIDLAAMRARSTILPSLTTPGYHTMIYRSRVDLPEGIVDGTEAGGLWAGPYQPYLVQVPDNPTTDLPVLLYLHGGGGNHLNNGTFAPQGGLTIGRSLAVFPYGRETTTANDHGYQGVSEQDVLDVLTDVRRNYPTDVARTLAVGVSTGGAGAWRMAQLHPDRFSAVLVISAYDDTHVTENLVNMPLVLHNGMADPAASQPVLALTLLELDQLGDVDYRSYSVAAHSHADPTAPISQCLVDNLLREQVVRDPARVVLALDPANDPPNATAGLALQHGQAYWLNDVRLRRSAPASVWHSAAGNPPGYGDNAVGRVDATSLAFAERATVSTGIDTADENVTKGATLCDAHTGDVPRTNDTWRIHGVDIAPGQTLATTNAADLSLRQIDALTLNLGRMRLSLASPLTLNVVGDGPTSLTLDNIGGGGDRVQISVDGLPLTVQRPRHGQLTVTLTLAGAHTVAFTPRS